MRYLAAAVAAGVVVRRSPDVLTLTPSAVPDWTAAVDHLTAPPTREDTP
ncbi:MULTISPECIES: hypothetical protein [unclassified Streptomyces]